MVVCGIVGIYSRLKNPLAEIWREAPDHGLCATSVLKARATLAWGEAPGHRPSTNSVLKARAKRLIPHKLQPLNHSRNRLGSCDKQSNVNVVRNSANAHANVLGTVENRSQVGMHLASNRIPQEWPALLGTEYQMHQHIREGLRHWSEYSAGLQPAGCIATLTWGCAPGYVRSGLQPSLPSTSHQGTLSRRILDLSRG
jgi:hypothetical protein